MRVKQGTYPVASLNYADVLLRRYALLKEMAEEIEQDEVQRIFSHPESSGGGFSGQVSDTTCQTATRLTENASLFQLRISILAIEKTLAALDDQTLKFVKMYFWGEKNETGCLLVKRRRRKVLTLLCHNLGLIEK